MTGQDPAGQTKQARPGEVICPPFLGIFAGRTQKYLPQHLRVFQQGSGLTPPWKCLHFLEVIFSCGLAKSFDFSVSSCNRHSKGESALQSDQPDLDTGLDWLVILSAW